MSAGRNLKPQAVGIRKPPIETAIILKIPNPKMQSMSGKTFMYQSIRQRIDRSQYADAVEENNKRYHENPQLYRKRQEINEHIFGTIKRQWGYNHTNLTGLEKIEHSLIMLVYNIKRSINILGVPDLIAKLKMELTLQGKSLVLLKRSI
jgi:hypothetical protein